MSHQYASDSENIYFCKDNGIYLYGMDGRCDELIFTMPEDSMSLSNVYYYNEHLYIFDFNAYTFWSYDINNKILRKIDSEIPHSGIIHTYCVINDTIYVMFGYYEGLYGINIDSGEVVNYGEYWGSMAVCGDFIYVLSGNLYEINIATHKTTMYDLSFIYKQSQIKNFFITENGTIYLITETNNPEISDVYYISTSDTYHFEQKITSVPTMFEYGGYIYFCDGKSLYRFNSSHPTPETVGELPAGMIFRAGNKVFVEDGDTVSFALDLQNH